MSLLGGLLGSGGVYDDQKKPAASQYILGGRCCNNEQEVRDAINAGSGWGSLGGTCPYCGLYCSSKDKLLDHESKCTYRK